MAARLESAAIAEESEEEEVVVAVLGCPNRQEDLSSVGMVQGPPWRSRTRTNPYVNWCPPDSVARMEKPVEVTELWTENRWTRKFAKKLVISKSGLLAFHVKMNFPMRGLIRVWELVRVAGFVNIILLLSLENL